MTTIEILLVNGAESADETQNQYEIESGTLEESELQLFEEAAFAIRNAAKIVDTPCSEMHTDQFVEVMRLKSSKLIAKT